MGEGFVSQRGLARMCGVSQKSISVLLAKLRNCSDTQTIPKILQPYAGLVIESDTQIPDFVASVVVQYYAYQGKEKAQDYLTVQLTRFVLGMTLNCRAIVKSYRNQVALLFLHKQKNGITRTYHR